MLCTTLISMHCDALTSTVHEWEKAQMRANNTKSIFDLLQKLPIMVSSLIADGTWPHKSSSTSKDFDVQFKAIQDSSSKTLSTSVLKSDLASFKSQMETLIHKSQSKAANLAYKAMIAHSNATNNSNSNNTNTNPGRQNTLLIVLVLTNGVQIKFIKPKRISSISIVVAFQNLI